MLVPVLASCNENVMTAAANYTVEVIGSMSTVHSATIVD